MSPQPSSRSRCRTGLALLVIGGHCALLWAVTHVDQGGVAYESGPKVVHAALLIDIPAEDRVAVSKPASQPRIRPPMNIEPAVPPELVFEEVSHTVAARQPSSAISVRPSTPVAHRHAGALKGVRAAAPVEEPPRADADYLDNPKPLYPAISRRLREEGLVLLRVLVNELGLPEVIKLETGSGHRRLDLAACAAVRRWRFVPARRGGNTVSAWVSVPIIFNLGDHR